MNTNRHRKLNFIIAFAGIACAIIASVITLIVTSCDMTYLSQIDTVGREITTNERDDLEKNGHFLKLTYMPRNTQVPNVMYAQAANSIATIAKLNTDDDVKIYRETETPTATVYLPLVYTDGSEFTETGSFFSAFAIHVDAVTSYIFSVTDGILVPFTDGRGELDVRTLPVSREDDAPYSRFLSARERDDMERNGHFLKLTYMPINTQAANVATVQIANTISAIARLDKEEPVCFFYEPNDTTTVYLPLIYNNDSTFTETGSFYTAFAIYVDVLNSYILSLSDLFMVPFTDGRGTIDVRTLPYRSPVEVDRRYLTIFNLPAHLLPQNVSKVSVNNQTGVVAICDDYAAVKVQAFDNSSTVQIPLSFTNPPSMFTGTGSFYVAFDLFIDALNHFTFTAGDRLLVPFVDGNGYLDINELPKAPPPDYRYLSIVSLPPNTLARDISKVIIYNQAGQVARCEDYSLIEVSGTTAKIPLSFINPPSMFTGTGRFIVTFDINKDATTRYLITTEEEVLVSFVDGNGVLNLRNIPVKPIPYLTIRGLPANTLINHISDVGVYGFGGTQVAECKDYDKIVLTEEEDLSITVKIPLSYSANDEYFKDTGRYTVSFQVKGDIDTHEGFELIDRLDLNFFLGSAEYNLGDNGFFDAELTNPNDDKIPIIKGGSAFDVDGMRVRLPTDLPVPAYPPTTSGIIYLYASKSGQDVFYEFSADTPEESFGRGGLYASTGNTNRRALWKMVYISEGNLFLFKTYVEDNFPHFGHAVISDTVYESLVGSKDKIQDISGANNTNTQTFSLRPGIYVVKLTGAGGGGGHGSISGTSISGSSKGGNGGTVSEVFIVSEPTNFTAFTGDGGNPAPPPAPTGTFSISGTKNYWRIYDSPGSIQGATEVNDLIYSAEVAEIISRPTASGGGGGGGGAGTFLYSPAMSPDEPGYFLVAGGGGGGSGASLLTPGGSGGSGGVIGSGAGGGAAGYLQQLFKNSITMTATSQAGQGGSNTGAAGQATNPASNRDGNNGNTLLLGFATEYAPLIRGSLPYQASDLDISSLIPTINKAGARVPARPQSQPALYDIPFVTLTTGTAGMDYRITDSGSGGSVPMIIAPSGPQAWLATNGANGAGAAPPPLPAIISSGLFPNYYYKSYGQGWEDSSISTFIMNLPDPLSFSFGTTRAGQTGLSGGNNRNISRGGGAPGGTVTGTSPSKGTAGSITIHIIMQQ